MARQSIAGKWMKAKGLKWSPGKHSGQRLKPKHEKTVTGQEVRKRRMAVTEGKATAWEWEVWQDRQSIRQFVEENRSHAGQDCLFVPAAQNGVPASLTFLGKSMSAARYMCILTHGAPRIEGAMVRHKCGNGHLSCVNPAHLIWGQQGDNIGDANIHRAMDGATIEDKCKAIEVRTSK